MSKSPVTVQQWVDTLPPPHVPPAEARRKLLARDLSLQSDDACSICSSVESVLELRRPDPEAVLLGLGFGPPAAGRAAGRIPQRFRQPSKLLSHIDINKFLEDQGELQGPEKQFPSAPSSPLRTRPKTTH